ncbi:hypothetical protein E8E13_001540 [Curvularia kusanoi]|uniref:Uncharacterized protein n=1 Tax=Curvularia kusanoi TaxID=90978 RepID=A0A9P4TCZ3_CURKU|nr:hypothetical protein E8E13_001540 [Curvularia kusanoi]
MVAFSRLALILAGTGLSTAQSFSGPPPSGAIPSGAPFPTGGFPEGPGHEHSGHHGGFPHPTGGFHPHGPKPSGTGIFGAQRAQQSDEAPFPKGPEFSAFPSGAARPSGHHHPGHHSGHHSGFPHPTGGFHPHGPKPSGTAIVGAKRAEASDDAPFPNFSAFPSGAAKPSGHHHDGHHSGFPYPTGGFHHPHGPRPSGTGVFGAQEAHRSGDAPFPSGTDFPAFPSGAARPSGHHGYHGHHGEGGKGGHHSGLPSGLPSGVPTALPSLAARAEGSLAPPEPTGALPTEPRPSGALPTEPRPSGAPPAGPRPSGARPPHASGSPPPRPSGSRPSGPPPSGKPTAAPSHVRHSTFVTSVTRAI